MLGQYSVLKDLCSVVFWCFMAAELHFVVSTLAVHGKYVSKDNPDTNDGCNGKIFCDVKPADYPEEEIERLVMKDLTLLHRRKRESQMADVPEPAEGKIEGNCKITKTIVTPYQLTNEDRVPKIIVQSKFFQQEIPYVECESEDQPCFRDLILDTKRTTACRQKTITTKLFVYDQQNQKIEPINGEIPIDCICETL